MESEDELLVARLYEDPAARPGEDRTQCETAMMQALAEQLPEGMDVLSVTLAASNASFVPRSAEYVLPVRIEEDPGLAGRLQAEMDRVMASERCVVERTASEDKAVATDRRTAVPSVDPASGRPSDRSAPDRGGRLDSGR